MESSEVSWAGFSSKTQHWQYRAGTDGTEKSTGHGMSQQEMVC